MSKKISNQVRTRITDLRWKPAGKSLRGPTRRCQWQALLVHHALVNLLADAHDFFRQLQHTGRSGTKDRTSPTEISRILPLAFLAPDIVRKMLEGRQPGELTAQTLKRTKPLPGLWSNQRQRLGFATAS
jgi:hypothetical protein